MFDGFERTVIAVDGVRINLVHGGGGPPVLLLHGYPETHAMWHALAPRLAGRHSVVIPDLRGYGDSDKPPGGADHGGYAKRAMALDQVGIMAALGHERFAVIGHDRGARVGHRLALDHPERVTRFAALDIVPTHTAFAETDREKATGYYHWFFLAQPHDLPERLIGNDPVYYLRWCLRSWGGGRLDYFAPQALAEYERCFSAPETIHATCEDYRAAASIDLEHDRADLERRITCPMLALWGEWNRLDTWYDVAAVWRTRAEHVTGRSIAAGHFLAEEKPEEVAAILLDFLLSP